MNEHRSDQDEKRTNKEDFPSEEIGAKGREDNSESDPAEYDPYELVEIRMIGGRGLVFSAVFRSVPARNAHFASVYAGFGGSWKAVSAFRSNFRRTAA